jgi:hypothetical protein
VRTAGGDILLRNVQVHDVDAEANAIHTYRQDFWELSPLPLINISMPALYMWPVRRGTAQGLSRLTHTKFSIVTGVSCSANGLCDEHQSGQS